jgi:hypothetical protein
MKSIKNSLYTLGYRKDLFVKKQSSNILLYEMGKIFFDYWRKTIDICNASIGSMEERNSLLFQREHIIEPVLQILNSSPKDIADLNTDLEEHPLQKKIFMREMDYFLSFLENILEDYSINRSYIPNPYFPIHVCLYFIEKFRLDKFDLQKRIRVVVDKVESLHAEDLAVVFYDIINDIEVDFSNISIADIGARKGLSNLELEKLLNREKGSFHSYDIETSNDAPYVKQLDILDTPTVREIVEKQGRYDIGILSNTLHKIHPDDHELVIKNMNLLAKNLIFISPDIDNIITKKYAEHFDGSEYKLKGSIRSLGQIKDVISPLFPIKYIYTFKDRLSLFDGFHHFGIVAG